MKHKFIGLLVGLGMFASCDDYLTRNPLDTVTDTPEFWNNEDNINTVVLGLYDVYFEGYRTSWNRADWFAETDIADWNDDNAQQQATYFTLVAPATDTKHWKFDYVRRINIIIDRVSKTTLLPEETRNHWLGVGRFLRAMEYAKLVSKFGDVPWYSKPLENTDYEELYKARTPRTEVMDNVLADLKFAYENIRLTSPVKGLYINKDVAYAFGSRIMLFEGTWQKYKEGNAAKATEYLQAAKEAADALIQSGRYTLCKNWKSLTTSADLAGNPEIIIYRSYVESVLMHSLMTFQVTESEINSPSKSLIETYLSSNGLPISQPENTLYKGDKWFYDEIADRDPRLYENIDTTGLRLTGVVPVWAVSGYFGNRFVNPALVGTPGGQSSTCITDAPVMKYNEVLLNYAEAAAELQQLGAYSLSQADLDKTINVIRDRESTQMPHVTLQGDALAVNGTVVSDPEKDADVPAVIWEIRRERRVELVYEGIRFNDIRRWGKLEYADMSKNTKLNKGAWLDKQQYIDWYNAKYRPDEPLTLDALSGVTLDRAGNAGYILPITDNSKLRTAAPKDYLYPIPQDQITLYKNQNKVLENNPGW